MSELAEELAELEARVRSALEHKAVYEDDMARIYALLPSIRAKDPKRFGPKVLEEMVHGLVERGTISRKTARAAGTARSAAAAS